MNKKFDSSAYNKVRTNSRLKSLSTKSITVNNEDFYFNRANKKQLTNPYEEKKCLPLFNKAPLSSSSPKINSSNDLLTKINLFKNELLLDNKISTFKTKSNISQPIKIFNWLLLGNKHVSENVGLLIKHNVDSIINVTLECINKFPDKFEYKKIPVCDTPKTNIQFYFNSTADYIEERRKKGKNVFVHCYMGKSRSVSIIISYMIKYHSFSYESAYAYIKRLKPDINPNRGFQNQLKLFKESLNKDSKNN